MKLTVVYEDVAVGAREAFVPSAWMINGYSNPELLRADRPPQDYMNPGELNNVLLDGTGRIYPDDLTTCVPIMSEQISDSDGNLDGDIEITLEADGNFSSQGITLVFSEIVGRYPKIVNIKWYNGSKLLYDKTYNPDSPNYYCEQYVESYNKLIITLTNVNMPQNYLTLNNIIYGLIRQFGRPDIETFTLLHDIDPVSSTLKIDTMDFSLKQKTDIEYVFQDKQAIKSYFDDELMSTTFVKKYSRNSRDSYEIATEDYMGLLDDVQFYGGMYTNKSLTELIAEILEPVGVPYTIADNLTDKTLTGYISVCTRREALTQVMFAIGAVADTSYSDKVDIYILSDEVTAVLNDNNTFTGQQTKTTDKITELRLYAYSYVESSNTYTAYQAAKSGTGTDIEVIFPEPLYDLSITNGTISESGTNYAIITANANCVLTGKKYDKTQSATIIRNPNILAGDKENIYEITNYTLVNRDNVEELAQACFDYYSHRENINETILASDIKVGDMVTQKYSYRDNITGRVSTMKYTVSGAAKVADVTIT